MLALVYAAPYGTTNQATYLLDPLHRALPDLFARDWFVSETPTYMPVWGWLAQWLFVLDPDGATAVVAAHLVIVVATYAAIYWLVSALDGGWCAFGIIAAFVTVAKGLSMGGSYLLPGYLQPSAPATLAWIIAMAAFARDRALTCGLAAAAAGALHPNFLVLGIGLFALAALACRWRVRDLATLMLPQLAVLACAWPQLAAAAGPTDHALWILSVVHAPVHYAPHRLLYGIPWVVCWQVAAYGAMYLLCDLAPARRLWRFSLIASGVACGSALLVQLASLHFVVQLFAARVAPFAQLACIVLVVAALVRHAAGQRELARLPRAVFAFGMVSALALYGQFLHHLIPPRATVIGCVACLAVVLAPRRHARYAVVALALLATGYALWARPSDRGITTRPSGTDRELALEDWARTHTASDALFLIPPELGRFRLLARRAVVVDTKSPPLRPDLLEQWYARLCAAVGVAPGPTAREIGAHYHELTAAQLEQIARAFDADYIVTGAHVAFPYPPVFHAADHEVFRTRR
jgi:hypothetical protein